MMRTPRHVINGRAWMLGTAIGWLWGEVEHARRRRWAQHHREAAIYNDARRRGLLAALDMVEAQIEHAEEVTEGEAREWVAKLREQVSP